MGAMRPEADDVLQEHLVIQRAARPVGIVLCAEQPELAGIVFEHCTGAPGRGSRTVDRTPGEITIQMIAVQLVITRAGTPARQETVHRLRVKPGLPFVIGEAVELAIVVVY